MKPRSGKPNPLLRLVFYAAMLFVVSWILLWGEHSFVRTWNMGHKVQALQKEMQELQTINEELKLENQRLKSDPRAAEKVAREKFGLTKEGEKVFRFIPSGPAAKSEAKADSQ